MQNWIISGDIHTYCSPDLPEEWQLQRFRSLWTFYTYTCRKHNAKLILSGDIWERSRPNRQESMLFIELCELLNKEGVETYIISGNHDFIDTKKPTLMYYEPVFNIINSTSNTLGYVQYNSSEEIFIPDTTEADIYMVGHPALQGFIKPELRKDRLNILVSHFRPTVNKFIKEEIDVQEFIDGFDVCIASDIHTDLCLYGGKLLYTNKPINIHPEPDPKCGCILLSIGDGKFTTERLPISLPKLLSRKSTAVDFRVPEEDEHFYIIEVEGTPQELRGIPSSFANAKIKKLPVVDEVYKDVDDINVGDTSAKVVDTEEALIEYMQGLGMEEGKIERMIATLRNL